MATFEDAFAKYPPSIPSHCAHRPVDPKCPPCLRIQPPATGTSPVRFQLTYTCDSATYSPCYYPRPICCTIPEKPPVKKIRCGFKWFDCCGRPVPECFF